MKRLGWYILLAKQGFENSIKEDIHICKEEFSIEDILVSEELSGYVFIRSIEISNDCLHFLLSINGVVKFLGKKHENGKTLLQKFSNSEIDKLRLQPKKNMREVFQIGDQIIIKRGDLADIEGRIIEIKKRIVKIQPTIFHKVVRARIQDIEFI
jgi:transcription antitermination factor NusG